MQNTEIIRPIFSFDGLVSRPEIGEIVDLTCDFAQTPIAAHQRAAADMAITDILMLSRFASVVSEEEDFGLYIENVATATVPMPDQIASIRSLVIRGLMEIGPSKEAAVSREVFNRRLEQVALHFQ